MNENKTNEFWLTAKVVMVAQITKAARTSQGLESGFCCGGGGFHFLSLSSSPPIFSASFSFLRIMIIDKRIFGVVTTSSEKFDCFSSFFTTLKIKLDFDFFFSVNFLLPPPQFVFGRRFLSVVPTTNNFQNFLFSIGDK